jgi:tetratricopeptide (TPR) repeat protein
MRRKTVRRPHFSLLWAVATLLSVTPVAHAFDTFSQALQEGRAKAKAGDFAAGQAAFQAAIGLAANPKEKAEALFAFAKALHDGAQPAAARVEFEKLVAMSDADGGLKSQAQVYIGFTYYHDRPPQLVQAREAFEKVLQIPGARDGDRMTAQTYIGRTYMDEKKFEEARGAFAKRLDIGASTGPEAANVRIFTALTYLYQAIPDADSALRAYAQVVEDGAALPPQKADALIGRGKILLGRREFDKAVAEYARILDLAGSPASSTANALLQMAYAHIGRQECVSARAALARLMAMPDVPKSIRAEASVLQDTAFSENRLRNFL